MNMVEPSSILSSQQPDPVFVMDSRATSKKPSSHSKRSNVPMSKERFSKQDFERIEIWLEQLPNLSSVFDIGGQTSIGLLNRPSAQENTKLAQVISNQSKDRQNLNTKAARERLDRFRRTDIAVKEKSKTTIFGITNEDRNSDIYTMAQKPESMRTSDVKLDALFEHRPKFTPLSTYTGGLALLKESRKANRVSQRQRRLLDEESEYEEEGGDEDRGERSHEEVEVIPDSSQILGGRDNEVINNNAAGDTRDLHDSTFDGEFRKDADGISDVNGQDTAQEIGLDPANDTTGEEISELSISTQLLFQPRQQKRQSTDQPQQQNKRPRPSGSRHISMSLHSSSLKLSRRTVWSSYEQKIIREVEALQDIEERKLDLERRRLEFEEAREARRLELEQRKLELENRRQKVLLIRSWVEKGMSIDQIRELLDKVDIVSLNARVNIPIDDITLLREHFSQRIVSSTENVAQHTSYHPSNKNIYTSF